MLTARHGDLRGKVFLICIKDENRYLENTFQMSDRDETALLDLSSGGGHRNAVATDPVHHACRTYLRGWSIRIRGTDILFLHCEAQGRSFKYVYAGMEAS